MWVAIDRSAKALGKRKAIRENTSVGGHNLPKALKESEMVLCMRTDPSDFSPLLSEEGRIERTPAWVAIAILKI